MKTNGSKKYLSEEEIDQIVVEQADDDDAWDEPVVVSKRPTTLSIPADLASKARITDLALISQR